MLRGGEAHASFDTIDVLIGSPCRDDPNLIWEGFAFNDWNK